MTTIKTFAWIANEAAVIMAIFIATIPYASCAAANEGEVLNDYTVAIGDTDALAARDIALLAEAYDTFQTYDFFNHRLEQLADAGPDALPALAALLNRDIWPHTPGSTGQLFDSLRERATEIWYEIRWEKANEQEQVMTAVVSLDPRSSIDLAPNVGSRKIRELGEKARAAIYELLMSDAEYAPNGLNYRRAGSLEEGVLGTETFAPTDAEAMQVLREGGEYGRFIMVYYLAHSGRYSEQWFTALSRLLDESSLTQQNHLLAWLLGSARQGRIPPDVMASNIAKLALDIAEGCVNEVVQGKPQPEDYSMLSLVAALLVFTEESEHLDRLKRLYEEYRQPLLHATTEEVLKDLGRYRGIKFNADATADWILKLEKQE